MNDPNIVCIFDTDLPQERYGFDPKTTFLHGCGSPCLRSEAEDFAGYCPRLVPKTVSWVPKGTEPQRIRILALRVEDPASITEISYKFTWNCYCFMPQTLIDFCCNCQKETWLDVQTYIWLNYSMLIKPTQSSNACIQVRATTCMSNDLHAQKSASFTPWLSLHSPVVFPWFSSN